MTLLTAAAAFAGMLLGIAPEAHATSPESVLYSFQASGSDGSQPMAPVVADAKGNLYGTTAYGGAFGYGTIFKVSPSGTETVLYSFTGGADGGVPYLAGVVLDKAGNIYGTTSQGGVGYGVVYRLTPTGVETPLYAFTGATDGGTPYAGVVLDKSGNLYGTTYQGGANGIGTVYKVTPAGIETVVYSFTGANDGCYPYGAGVVFGPKNTLYGAASQCGAGGYGTVYTVTLSGKETTLHSFAYDGTDGIQPYAGVVLDKAHNVYGTTYQGGANSVGTVYEISKSGTETILHSFVSDGSDGFYPFGAGVALDKLGNIFGTTTSGGAYGYGIIYELNSSGYTVKHSFGNTPDGANPYASVIVGKHNTIYGTTAGGGANGNGSVFSMTY